MRTRFGFRGWAGIAGASLLALVVAAAYLHASIMPPDDIDYGRTRASDGGAYRATIAPVDSTLVKVGRMHAWRLHLETASGEPVDGAAIEVDGGMPQHGHGYPTRPRVTRALGGGDYLVEGVKFNMGGWWTMQFGIAGAAGRDSVTFNLKL